MKKELGIYIHIPFCKQKCIYCDFISFSKQDENFDKYIECLLKEIEVRKKEILDKNYKITTIYIGGGTPSLLSSNSIEKILNKLKNLDIKLNKLEITIEINPGTVNKEKLEHYKKMGINRLSIGMQSSKNNILKQLGRIHTYEEFEKNFYLAKRVGFKNINIDMIIGLPNQTIEDIKKSLENIKSLNPEHISVYSLILEEGTKLYEKVIKREVVLPKEETERNMYWYVKNKLEEIGYIHYEISNFAKKGKESKHNLNCWAQKEYIGFGLAAHSYKNYIRYSNIENLEQYMKNIENDNISENIVIHEKQSLKDAKKEYMLLGLRKINGIQVSEFKQKYVENPIYIFHKELDKLTNEKLILIDDDNIRLTNKGIDLANIVWGEFV